MSKKVPSSGKRHSGMILFLVLLILLLVMALGVMVFSLYGMGVSLFPQHARTPVPTLSAEPASTPAPTATAVPTSTPDQTAPTAAVQEPTPSPEPTVLPEIASGYYDSYFDDAVFVGDSVTQGLQYYVMYRQGQGENTLGNAKFLAAASYNLATAGKPFNESKINVTYQGTAMSIEDAVSAMGARHMFIMLGLNDWAGSAVDANIKLYRAMLERVLAAVPDLKITVQSCTPVTPEGEKPKLTSASMDKFNEALKALCQEMGIEYLDVATPLKNAEGKLNPAYSSDNYVHLNNDGLRIWVDTLHGYALWHEVAQLEAQGIGYTLPADAPAREQIVFSEPETTPAPPEQTTQVEPSASPAAPENTAPLPGSPTPSPSPTPASTLPDPSGTTLPDGFTGVLG